MLIKKRTVFFLMVFWNLRVRQPLDDQDRSDFSHNSQCGIVFCSEPAVWEKWISHSPWRHNQNPIMISYIFLPKFEIDSNFLWKHINYMFSEKLREKNNSACVNPCGIRKSHPGGLIFWSGTRQASSMSKYSSLGWDFLIPHGFSWWILLISILVARQPCSI